ncbi:hypothetical protein pb186bvf_010509 [Paramecium bursaria]
MAKQKAIHLNKIKSNAPFSKLIKKKEMKEQGRRPTVNKSLINFEVSEIKNKQKRQEVLERKKHEQKKQKKLKKKENKQNPDRVKLDPLTIDDKREIDENFVVDDDYDEELQQEELQDEFEKFYKDGKNPKIMITTSERPTRQMYEFLTDIKQVFSEETYYWPRKQFSLPEIQEYAIKEGYTDLLVFREDRKIVNQLILVHLPEGPTLKFRIKNFIPCQRIHNHGRVTDHHPELLLHNFNTKVGRRVGRCLSALFPIMPDFKGRRAVTFHNQRDFIFFRHHRYMFKEGGEKCDLQEIGPRFSLQLQELRLGPYDDKAEIEFLRKDNMYVSRTAAYL